MAARLEYAPVLMGREAAAAYIDVSLRKLDELQAKSAIVPKRNGGKRGFLKADLDSYAANLPDWERD